MTDLELTKACAEAMGLKSDQTTEAQERIGYWLVDGRLYDPLTFDAQAMALVKEFELTLAPPSHSANGWIVKAHSGEMAFSDNPRYQARDLNRAIVECVAKMGKCP